MKNFPKYPHIEQLAKMTDILKYKCVVTEKIHGTNVRMMYDEESKLVLGSRENIIYKDGLESGSLYGFTTWCKENDMEFRLKKYPGYVFYGEYHGPGVQKGISYCKDKDLRIFDILTPEGHFVNWPTVQTMCAELCLKTVIEIASGMITVEYLQSIRDSLSRVAIENGINDPDNTAEGVVIKPSNPQKDRHDNWLMAKYKSDKWAERAKQAKPKDIDPDKMALNEQADAFAESVVTEGRVSTVIDHLTRNGNPELKMSRTGEFLREFVNDVMESEKEVYEKLDKSQKNVYNKAINQLASAAWKKHVEGI
jgi:Rnl2 family RNA ligase